MPTCIECGEPFESKRSDAQFCKDSHRKRHARIADTGAISPDIAIADTVIADKAETGKKLYAEAKRLTLLQQTERGLAPGPVIDGKQLQTMGPYVPTPEREARAREILRLRKEAARIPLSRAA